MRLVRAVSGDAAEASHSEAEFDDLFRSTWPRAVAAARRIVGPGGDPESLAAEALTRAYDRWPSVRRHPAPDAWALRVTINLALDRSRRDARAHGRPGRGDAAASTVDAADDVTAMRMALGHALRSLPEKQRHAVALRYLAGCEEADIARSLGVSPGTVKTHLKRGLDRLRTELGVDQETDVALRF